MQLKITSSINIQINTRRVNREDRRTLFIFNIYESLNETIPYVACHGMKIELDLSHFPVDDYIDHDCTLLALLKTKQFVIPISSQRRLNELEGGVDVNHSFFCNNNTNIRTNTRVWLYELSNTHKTRLTLIHERNICKKEMNFSYSFVHLN